VTVNIIEYSTLEERQVLTDKGLALEITAKGTKYYKDDDLN